MKKIVIFIFSLTICGIVSAGDYGVVESEVFEYFIPIRKKDSIKSDTVFSTIRMGNELKLTLNKAGEIGVLINNIQTITVKSDGFTGFGTKNPQHRVDVCGTIRASEELIVEAHEWCDFVFDEDYIPQPFNERMDLIKSQKHLPYVRSEEEITNSGISVSETISGLLRNIEELYLYIENLEERINILEEENKKLSSESND